jgi:hypothetical protein
MSNCDLGLLLSSEGPECAFRDGDFMKKTISWGLALGLFALSTFAGTAAYADDSDNTLRIVEQIAPGLLASTYSNGELKLGSSRIGSVSGGVTLTSKGSSDQRVSLKIDYASEVSEAKQGLNVLRGLDPAVGIVTQQLEGGFRILTTLTSQSKSKRFDYSFDLPAGSELQKTQDGYLMVSGNQVVGALSLPWALDSTGKSLKTHYDWKNNVLTQVLDENSNNVTFPVLMDPAWNYVLQYNLKNSPEANFNRLQNCFNCYFPVPGAPRNYPHYGDLLPLTMLGGNFECTMGSTYQSARYREFDFNATRNHIDQYGSRIAFQMTYAGSQSVLVVRGYVVNEFGGTVGQWLYTAGAGAMWQSFATNLNSLTLTK